MTSGNERLSLAVDDGFEARVQARAKPQPVIVSMYTDAKGAPTPVTPGKCFPMLREPTRIFACTRA